MSEGARADVSSRVEPLIRTLYAAQRRWVLQLIPAFGEVADMVQSQVLI